MIEYRHFLNTDPPWIREIWRQQPPLRGLFQDFPLLTLEQKIFAKPYFDPRGLILAIDVSTESQKPIGFVHASFAPNENYSDMDSESGIVSQLKVVPGEHEVEVADHLLRLATEYLAESAVTEIHGGACFPFSPFYLGLYGGSEVPGVLNSDRVFYEALIRNGFVAHDQVNIWQRQLSGFRPIGGREQMLIRRQYQINAVVDPLEQSWWECCTLGMAERERFSIYHTRKQVVCGNVSFWDMQPMARQSSHSARGLYGLNVPEEFRRTGIATFLVGESLKYFMQQNIEMVEAQTLHSDPAAGGVFKKLGFELMDQGTLMSKSV